MNDPLAVQRVQQPGDGAANVEHGLELQLPRLHYLMERPTGQPLHDQDEPRAVVLQRIGARNSFEPLLPELLQNAVLMPQPQDIAGAGVLGLAELDGDRRTVRGALPHVDAGGAAVLNQFDKAVLRELDHPPAPSD